MSDLSSVIHKYFVLKHAKLIEESIEQIPTLPTPCVIVENPSNKELDATPEADEPIYTTQHYNPDQDRNE